MARLLLTWCTKITKHKINKDMFLEHRRSHKQHSYICRNSQQYIVWVFAFMLKIIRILRSCSLKIFSICHIINLIIECNLNNFKGDFFQCLDFFAPSDSQILSKPYINGNMIYYLASASGAWWQRLRDWGGVSSLGPSGS